MAEHVVLVGMMGSGKTAVGRALAARLGRPFVDLDEVVAHAAGRSVAEVFADEGEDAFRERETAALSDALAAPEPSVIATGGGVVERDENRARLAGAHVVWLRAAPETLARRVGSGRGRPLLAGGDLPATLERLAAYRAPLYEAVARRVVDVDDPPVDEVAGRIADAVATT